jgi:hypothetical protein
MIPLTIYHRVLSLGGLVATLVAMTAGFGLLAEDQFGQCYERAV